MNARTLSGLGIRERDYPLPEGPRREKVLFRVFTAVMGLVILAFMLGLTSCSVGYNPGTGAVALTNDPAAIAAVSNIVTARINERLAQEQFKRLPKTDAKDSTVKAPPAPVMP